MANIRTSRSKKTINIYYSFYINNYCVHYFFLSHLKQFSKPTSTTSNSEYSFEFLHARNGVTVRNNSTAAPRFIFYKNSSLYFLSRSQNFQNGSNAMVRGCPRIGRTLRPDPENTNSRGDVLRLQTYILLQPFGFCSPKLRSRAGICQI